MAERITGADFDKKVKNADGLVLLDFYSDSCIPCKQLSPVLGELEEAYAGKPRSIRSMSTMRKPCRPSTVS